MLLFALIACSQSASGPRRPVQVIATNSLTEPVTIAAGGAALDSLAPSLTTSFSFPPGTTTLTWTPSVPQYGNGSPVPGDLVAQTVALPNGADTVEITNVLDGQVYFTPDLKNASGVAADIAIVDGDVLRCVLSLVPGVSDEFQLAYYRLTSTVEVRVYKGGTNCTGPFLYWLSNDLAAYAPKSGYIQLTVTAVP